MWCALTFLLDSEVQKDLLNWGSSLFLRAARSHFPPRSLDSRGHIPRLYCSDRFLHSSFQTTGAVGFRLDAIKHFDRRFLLRFVGVGAEPSETRLNPVADHTRPAPVSEAADVFCVYVCSTYSSFRPVHLRYTAEYWSAE